ncbi:MAG: MIP/aquaporin family protein [Opitutales bacterium]
MKNKLIAEFIGTYFLYLIIGLCVTSLNAPILVPLAVAIGLSALVYSCGHISKAHFNPATTLAYYCAGTHPGKEFLPYLLAIVLGASAAAITVPFLYPEGLEALTVLQPDWHRVLISELLFTFALMWVILNVAIAKKTAGNGFYGIAIGAIVGAGAYAVGPISFAAFNPAVTLALCIDGLLPWSALAPYIMVQFLAAGAAGLLFRTMQITEPGELAG